MRFPQLFDFASGRYTYLLDSGAGHEAFILDPVKEHKDRHLLLISGITPLGI